MCNSCIPFGRIPLLFHLCKHTFRLVVYTVRASRHFPIALDLLLPTHIASLQPVSPRSMNPDPPWCGGYPTLAILLRFASLLSSIKVPSPKSGCDKSIAPNPSCPPYPPKITGGGFIKGGACIFGIWKPLISCRGSIMGGGLLCDMS